MRKKSLIIFGIIIVSAMIVGFFITIANMKQTTAGSSRPYVSVSIYPLYEVARHIAGDTLRIESIVPLGSDPHLFSPNPQHIAHISDAFLFVYGGAGFEHWAEQLKTSLSSETKVIDMSTNVKLITSHHQEESDGDAHHHGSQDPHYWLDIDNMISMTHVFEAEFSKILPKNSARYHDNAQAYITQLEALKTEYANGLKECRNRTFVSNHDAFGYLAHANNIETLSVIGLSSDEQPSAKNIADIVSIVKEKKIKTIFFEEMVNDNVAQTIARETGAKADSLQPLENISEDELKSQQTYLSIMRGNLAKLREAMECR